MLRCACARLVSFSRAPATCGDDCPLIPGVERDEWPVDDPEGRPPEAVRRIRDEIRRKVVELVKERKWE